MTRGVCHFASWLALSAATCAAAPGAWAAAPDRSRTADCSGPATRDRIERVDATDELVLGSGRRVRLADVRLADSTAPGRPSVRAWLVSLAGQEVDVTVAGEPDRWGRTAARLAIDAGAIDIADLLVGEGLALVDPGERDTLCRPDLLAVERKAREARRGVWAAGTLLLSAVDLEALKAAAGRFGIIEGRVVSVGERSARTYLNFGRDFTRDFAIVVPRRQWAALKRAGATAEALKGRLVRIRGIVDLRRAPSIEIVSVDALEW